MIPYAEIIETADRRWTLQLLDRLACPDLMPDEQEHVVEALQAVSDHRAVPTLENILADRDRATEVRNAASRVLRGMQYLSLDWPEEVLRRWWHEGDPILRRHALLSMDVATCPDVVRAVAAERRHPLRVDAFSRMTFSFDRPEDEAIKLSALADPDPAVRAEAASVLFWDEPVAAEAPLLAASHDPDERVAVEATTTLRYYPTLRVIQALAGLLADSRSELKRVAGESLDELRAECLLALGNRDRRVAEHVRRWLEPVWEVLAFTEEELAPEEPSSSPAPKETPQTIPIVELLALLHDPTASPKVLGDRLWSNHWAGYSPETRQRFLPIMLHHDDPLVRERATLALEAWGDAAGLLGLLRDPDFGVRKMAMYHLGQLPRTPSLASVAWEHLHKADVCGVHATETLDTFVAHAEPADAIAKLLSIAADSSRSENLRVAALEDLTRLEAVVEVGQLTALLAGPPVVTWTLHIAVLNAVAELGLTRPDICHLREVDNLHLQAAIASLS